MLTCDQAFFFPGKWEKKETPDTFISQVVCRPLIKVSFNTCVIVPDLTGNSSGLQKRQLLSTHANLL